MDFDLDAMDPASPEVMADSASIAVYERLRTAADEAAAAVLGLGARSTGTDGGSGPS
jgi:hypothetical protein